MTLPNSWTTAPLSAVCSKITDGSHNPPKPQSTGRPMLSAKNIINREIRFDDYRLISESDFESEDKRTQIAPGDVLLTIVGAIGRSAVVQPGLESFTLQRSVAVLKPTALVPCLLSYALEAPKVQQYLNDNAKGTAQKGIYLKALGGVSVPVPPLAEQQRIADKLDTILARVDAVNDRLARVGPLLKRFRQAVLAAATSGRLTAEWRAGHATEPWRDAQIGQLLLGKPRNGYSPKSVDYPTTVRSLTLSATTSGKFKSEHCKFIDEPIPGDSHLWLQPGDILIQRANSLDYVGVSAIYDGPASGFIYPDLMMKAQANTDVTFPRFLHIVLSSDSVRTHFRENATGTAGNMPKINQQTVIGAPCRLPSKAEQAEIVRRVDILFAFADRLEARLQAAQTASSRLTPSLLAKAFRGELVPQDPADEPAAELLRRLAASKTPAAPRRKAWATSQP